MPPRDPMQALLREGLFSGSAFSFSANEPRGYSGEEAAHADQPDAPGEEGDVRKPAEVSGIPEDSPDDTFGNPLEFRMRMSA